MALHDGICMACGGAGTQPRGNYLTPWYITCSRCHGSGYDWNQRPEQVDAAAELEAIAEAAEPERKPAELHLAGGAAR